MIEFLRSNAPLIAAVTLLVLWLVFRTSATRLAPGSSPESVLEGSQPLVLEFFGNT